MEAVGGYSQTGQSEVYRCFEVSPLARSPDDMLMDSFSVDDLKELLKHANVKPVVNQILLHPYVIKDQQPLLDFLAEKHIVPEGYSTLIPVTSKPGGPVDKPLAKLAKKYNAEPAQILLAWSKAKGYVDIRAQTILADW